MTQDVPRSDEIATDAAVQSALDRLAREITERLAGSRPLVVTVLNGSLVFAGQLLPRLQFALETDYVHVRRYGRGTKGGELVWIAGPQDSVAGRTVLLVTHDPGEAARVRTPRGRRNLARAACTGHGVGTSGTGAGMSGDAPESAVR